MAGRALAINYIHRPRTGVELYAEFQLIFTVYLLLQTYTAGI